MPATGVIFDVYVVFEGGDDRSRGRPSKKLVFTDRAKADEASMYKGYFRSKAHIKQFKAITDIDGKAWLIAQEIEDLEGVQATYEKNLREAALAKLSDEEKRVLGVE